MSETGRMSAGGPFLGGNSGYLCVRRGFGR